MSRHQSYQTKISVYTITRESTIDQPAYKISTNYDVVLSANNFKSLTELKNAIKDRTQAGFLHSQFFRVSFKQDFETAGVFLQNSDDVQQAFQQVYKDSFLDLVIVRYTKVQSQQMKSKISQEEFRHLDALMQQKRSYTRKPDGGEEHNSDDEVPPNVGMDRKFLDSFPSLGRTPIRNDYNVDLLNNKQAQYYNLDMLADWNDQVLYEKHNSTIIPPINFPIVSSLEGPYVQISIPARLYSICLQFACIINND
ncbi:hypothetical protein SS50377_28257 [Spironucleus salmonicida]|uniref:Uncharacterized protein n=1 Tax=Spironucleus salmonicida TaxID=348837 RepID=V6LXJ2_9EUKA|nr:hypothetical protein SS50377_28257 [Spironucleus salmonicida]|eukprot:EST48436.1 hypothetical protein SS50377_11386 [Spironucleus salmonicida]